MGMDACRKLKAEDGRMFLGCTIGVGLLAFFKSPSNQIQQAVHAHTFVEKIDHLLDGEAGLLASYDQPTNRAE